MQPWILEQVAHEHRRDLLAKADRWRLAHARSVESLEITPATLLAATPAKAAAARPTPSGLSRIWMRRRTEQVQCGDAAAATTVTSAARYAS